MLEGQQFQSAITQRGASVESAARTQLAASRDAHLKRLKSFQDAIQCLHENKTCDGFDAAVRSAPEFPHRDPAEGMREGATLDPGRMDLGSLMQDVECRMQMRQHQEQGAGAARSLVVESGLTIATAGLSSVVSAARATTLAAGAARGMTAAQKVARVAATLKTPAGLARAALWGESARQMALSLGAAEDACDQYLEGWSGALDRPYEVGCSVGNASDRPTPMKDYVSCWRARAMAVALTSAPFVAQAALPAAHRLAKSLVKKEMTSVMRFFSADPTPERLAAFMEAISETRLERAVAKLNEAGFKPQEALDLLEASSHKRWTRAQIAQSYEAQFGTRIDPVALSVTQPSSEGMYTVERLQRLSGKAGENGGLGWKLRLKDGIDPDAPRFESLEYLRKFMQRNKKAGLFKELGYEITEDGALVIPVVDSLDDNIQQMQRLKKPDAPSFRVVADDSSGTMDEFVFAESLAAKKIPIGVAGRTTTGQVLYTHDNGIHFGWFLVPKNVADRLSKGFEVMTRSRKAVIDELNRLRSQDPVLVAANQSSIRNLEALREFIEARLKLMVERIDVASAELGLQTVRAGSDVSQATRRRGVRNYLGDLNLRPEELANQVLYRMDELRLEGSFGLRKELREVYMQPVGELEISRFAAELLPD